MERPGEEPISPLYRRLMETERLTVEPEGTEIRRIDIEPPATFGDRIRLEVFFRDGTRDTQYLLPDGRVLKGGLSSDETYAQLQRVIQALERSLPSEGDLPGMFHIPREAFDTDERGPREVAGGGPDIIRIRDRGVDERRKNAIRSGVLRFEFDIPKGAFAGYICGVYPHGILLDNPQKENAAFECHIPNLLASLGIDPSRGTLSEDEIERIKTHITTVLLPSGTTKRELVERGAERICHIGDWQVRVRRAVDSLLKG